MSKDYTARPSVASDQISTLLEEIAAQQFPEWEDEAVSSLWLMGSPAYIIAIAVTYLAFVTVIGPRWMEHRRPFELKRPILVYNIFQVIANAGFLFFFLREEGILSHIFTESLYPVIPSRNKRLRLFGLYYTWVWWLIKVSDLFDTVIFVLRKKQSHVTFLHVYHHSVMAFFTWLHFNYVRGEPLIVAGLINSFVHVAMYSYYFLSALGPQMEPYLWWKRYLTRLQIIQFTLIFGLYVYLVMFCKLFPRQKLFMYFAMAQTIIFFGLFMNFYLKAYKKPLYKPTSATKVLTNKVE